MNAIQPLIDDLPGSEVWEPPEMRAALAQRDFGEVYRLLQKLGYSQQRIGALTGQSQPEVSAIIHGRQVMAIDVIERIVWGLAIPPHYAGLACPSCTHANSGGQDGATLTADLGSEPTTRPTTRAV